jgi:hypothetical protein
VARAPDPAVEDSPAKETRAEETPAAEPAVATAELEPVVVAPAVEQESAAAPAATQEHPPHSQRPTPRSVVVPIPAEELRPVPPPPAADHARAAIVTAAATVAVAFVAFVTLRGEDGRVTTESSGIAAPAPAVLDSLPPLTFPLPDTGATPQTLTADSAVTSETTPRPDQAPQLESSRVAAVVPSRNVRPTAARTRRRGPVRRPRTDSIALAREARRVADSTEREAIRRELEHRRARLDTIERSLEPVPTPPDR